MTCQYCNTRGGENRFHKGTCDNCGAPLSDELRRSTVNAFVKRQEMAVTQFATINAMAHLEVADAYDAMLQLEWS